MTEELVYFNVGQRCGIDDGHQLGVVFKRLRKFLGGESQKSDILRNPE
ncbi:hypothetical protein SDC9_110517 [bioreactor metagenome]|uniref:Uncharacterized protein n=1 Tax=bioreactor metagenome TaxID=1076179 RepID=A0A645BEU9_9ZZZZ